MEDDNLEIPHRREAERAIMDVLGDLVYTPADWDPAFSGEYCLPFPLNNPNNQVNKEEMIRQGKHVMLAFTGQADFVCNDPIETWKTLVWYVEVEAHKGGYFGDPLLDGHSLRSDRWIFTYEDRLVNPNDDTEISALEAQEIVRNGVGVIGLDFPNRYTRHSGLIWSWDVGFPSTPCDSGTCCAAQMDMGKWRDEPCHTILRFACRRTNGEWLISQSSGKQHEGFQKCSEMGADVTFELPTNAYYNAILNSIRQTWTDPIWLPYTKFGQNGVWKKLTFEKTVCGVEYGSVATLHTQVTRLDSPNQQYFATMQGDGNFVVYNVRPTGNAVIWQSKTGGNPGATAHMQGDGNFMIYDANGAGIFNAQTAGRTVFMQLHDDGSLKMYDEECGAVWSTPSTSCLGVGGETWSVHTRIDANDRLYSKNGRYFAVMQGDGNFAIYANDGGPAIWTSNTHNNDGAYGAMQPDGHFCIYSSTGSFLWGTGTYGHPNAFMQMHDSGHLIIYDPLACEPIYVQ